MSEFIQARPAPRSSKSSPASDPSSRPGSGKFLGFPLQGFGLFTSLLLSVAFGFFTFFASTCIAIFSLLGWNVFGHHTVNYADSYLYIGAPAGAIVLLLALPLFGALWLRARLSK